LGANVIPVPMDDDGMDVDAVEQVLARLEREGKLPRVKLVYCTSYFDNPTGLTLSLERRRRLVEMVKRYSRQHRILIHEDAAYRELRYDGPSLASMKSMDPENQYTILSHTFSKPFAPGIKLGYTAMPADLLDAVLQQKGNHDFGSSNLCQYIALEALRDGSYQKHVQVLCQAYRKKRDAIVVALNQYMPRDGSVTWTVPHGGLYVWVSLPEGTDSSRNSAMFKHAVEEGVLYVPGDYCFVPDEQGQIPKNYLRLSFGQVAPDQIEPGIQRLGRVVTRELNTVNEPVSVAARK
jgi:2-aminoadipate transaminase